MVGFFFFLCINLMMLALVPVEIVFPQERSVFLKEESAKLYTTSAYFMSRNVIEVPYSIIFPLLQTLIMYWFVGLSSTAAQFFTFYLICYLISFSGMSLGLMLGSMVSDAKSVSSITPMLMLPFILFSGLFKNSGNLPAWIGWIQYISPIKYTFSAFL
jgi:ATP-binding cassette, subfamily G (WHITE), eye pigment precursor transporter